MAKTSLDSSSHAPSNDNRAADWLVGGGEMGKLIRSMDWSATALGPIETWPQSLRTTVGLALASNFPMAIAWGPGHVQIYNDGYWPICGGKHPHSMGQDFSVCWESAWPVIGESFGRASAGETSYLENQRMFLDRNGYLEETFFTFSFSPIRGESGEVAGLFHPVTENTAQMLSERRTRTLRDLSARAGKARSSEESLLMSAHVLAEAELDLPFVLLYVFDPLPERARLIGSAGLHPGSSASPEFSALEPAADGVWPFERVLRTGETQLIEQLELKMPDLHAGPYPESPRVALVMPIMLPGSERPQAVMIAGVSSRLPLNETYRAFYDLLAVGVTSSFATAHAYEQERQRAEALAELDRAKTEFFSNVSHEFRTPLTLMLGPLEEELRERRQPLPAERRERLLTAHRNTLRLLKLVNTLLDFSRIEAGRVQASFEPSDLAALTAELASVFRSTIEQAGLSLEVDCPPLPEPIYIDHDMWEKVVLNILSNAFKHTFEGGISVGLRWHGEFVELAVTDSGVGISAEELPRLFERFHRVKGTRSRTHEGTGIGLALVHELVAAHGGEVRVESEPGRGSTFRVTVRAGQAHLDPARIGTAARTAVITSQVGAYVQEALHWLPQSSARNSQQPQPPSAADAVGGAITLARAGARRSRILWADDNADMRDYVTRLLADRYDVIAVADGNAALQAAQQNPPDLVLSDMMMPGLDGFGLLRALRADKRTKTVPVILLSARAGEEAAVEGLDAGADDYLVKPFASRELLARVRTHLSLASLRREWARELEQANRELEAFSYSVSHDLRAPLRAIDGFSKALLAHAGDGLDEQGKAYLARVRAAAHRMSGLIDDLLELSRVSRGPMQRDTVKLGELAQRVFDELRRQLPARQLSLEIEPGLSVQADPRLVLVMLENLLGNACKFTQKREHGHIRMGRTSAGAPPTFFIADDGAGFNMNYADKLFQPFSRLHAQHEFEGTGVGLATVQRIVARHGGRVWAEGRPDAGATFYFTLSSET
jgi:signal transduction histidine kinase